MCTCRHCSRATILKARGLCSICYRSPGIRTKYAVTINKYARRGPGNCYRSTPIPAMPTTALPGTAAKQTVLEKRADLNEELFHPYDARYEGDPRTMEFLRGTAVSAA